MYKLTLKTGEVMHVKTQGITITLKGGQEYDQNLLHRLYEDGLKCVTKAKESTK